MTHFDETELEKLAQLCRIECSLEEKKKICANLTQILNYAEQLKEVNTEEVATCNSVLETLQNVLREDEVGKPLSREAFLSNAPAHIGGMVRVPPVIKIS